MTIGVSCRDLCMEFGTGTGTVSVLRGVGFEAEAGKLTMLVGPSGCGKTTVISIVAGLLRCTSGRAWVFDQEVTALAPAELEAFRLRTIGFVFQQYNLLAGLSAAENAAVPLVAAGLGWGEALEAAKILLARLDLDDHAEKLPAQLSGGQQQRVAIARALIHRPRLLLCDEPTAALDGKAGQAVMARLKGLAVDPDRAAIVVSHDTRVFGYADRIVRIEDGVVVGIENGAAPSLAPTEDAC